MRHIYNLSRTSVLTNVYVFIDHSEAAQAKMKGLSDTPEPPPRPVKDVNLYQNNQVKVMSSKDKVPLEIKSNILKARADEERQSGKFFSPSAQL